MPTPVDTQSTGNTAGRRRSMTDGRRGRSRSPSAYLKKKGKSLRGFFSDNKKKSSSSSRKLEAALQVVQSSPTKSSTVPKIKAVITPATTVEKNDKAEQPVVITTDTDTAVEKNDKVEQPVVVATDIDSDSIEQPESQAEVDLEELQESVKDTTTEVTTDPTATESAEDQIPGLSTDEKPTSGITSNTVQIILLLMDPKSRRFELLQLEFDSAKAIVQDLLSQIPSSATEFCVRDQKYAGICTLSGVEMTCTHKLKDFVKENEGVNSVVLAMPEGVSPTECAKMSVPILTDDKVAAMVNPTGAKLIPIESDSEDEEIPKVSSSDPTPKTTDETTPELTDEPTEEGASTKSDEETTPAPTEEKTRAFPTTAVSEPSKINEGDEAVSPIRTAIMFIILLLPFFYKYHGDLTSPLSPGDKLTPGQWHSYCGIMIRDCEPKSISFDKAGVLTYYHDKDVVWQMMGGSCDDTNSDVKCEMEVAEDGSVMIASEKARFTDGSNVAEGLVSPWPFTVEIPLDRKEKKKFGRK